MGFLSSIVGAVAGPLVGAIGSSRADKRAQARDGRKLQTLVSDAKKAGFNPLTALRGGAGYGGATAPALSTAQFLAEAVSSAFEAPAAYRAQQLEEERQRLENEALRTQLADREAKKNPYQNFGFDVPSAKQFLPQTKHAGPALSNATRPQSRPTFDSMGTVPVFLPDGQMRNLNARVAARMDLKPYDAIVAGDYPELVGELRGEGETALASGTIAKAIGIPIWGSDPSKPTVTVPKLSPPPSGTFLRGGNTSLYNARPTPPKPSVNPHPPKTSGGGGWLSWLGF